MQFAAGRAREAVTLRFGEVANRHLATSVHDRVHASILLLERWLAPHRYGAACGCRRLVLTVVTKEKASLPGSASLPEGLSAEFKQSSIFWGLNSEGRTGITPCHSLHRRGRDARAPRYPKHDSYYWAIIFFDRCPRTASKKTM